LNERYTRHEAALSTLSRSYALKPEDLTVVLREIAEVVSRTLEVERVSMWTYNNSRTAIRCLEEYERSTGRHSQGRELKRADNEIYFKALDESDVIAAADASTDPRTRNFAVDSPPPPGIHSLLEVPLHARGATTGVLRCEHVGRPREWKPDEQTFAVAVANLVSMLFAQLEQQQLEIQLRQTQKLEALGTLAGGIAHDFNNILGAIIAFTELSRMDHPGDTALQENLGEILKASNRAAGLVRQILAFSRQQSQERRPVQLESIVKEALALMRSTLPATIEIREELAANLPPVLADATQMHQVLMNLCTNAGHAMGGRPGRLLVRLEQVGNTDAPPGPEPGPGARLLLTVSDTGHGMNTDTLGRIFDPFFTTKAPGEGTGLGLAVVHGIIKEHDGLIEVESTPGVGTTFRVLLPAIQADRQPVPPPPVNRLMPGGHRILFVDDEVSLGSVARRFLPRFGFEVEVMQRPDEALAAFRRDPARYDAVITDLTMPLMTGTDLALRLLRLRPGIPVFVATGFGGDLNPDSARAMGIRDLILKPIDFPALARRLNAEITSAAPARPQSRGS
jgi:signal transduction histidine kinase/ActR/RegA family two-component response regulator